MKLLRGSLICLLVFLLLVSVVLAASFDVDIVPVKDRVLKNESALYKLIVKNDDSREINFRISSPNVITTKWTVLTDPIKDSEFSLRPGMSKTADLKIRAIGADVGYGAHTIIIEVEGDGTKIRNNLNVNLINPSGYLVTYLPRVVVEPQPEYPGQVNPNEPFDITLHLLNKNSLDIPEVLVKVSSNFFKEEKTLPMGPYEKADLKFSFDMSPHTLPQEDTLYIKLLVDNEVITSKEFNYEIIPAEVAFKVDDKVEKSFLKKTTIYSVSNPSNVKRSEDFRVPVSFFGRLVSSTEPDAGIVSKAYQWKIDLYPEQVEIVSVTYNYRYLLLAIIIIILLVFVYQYFKPDIVITKKAKPVFSSEDGTLTGAKIVLSFKNATNHTLRNVRIIDKVPKISSYIPKEILGSIKPTKIRSMEAGDVLTWELGDMFGKDERIITYKIKAKLKVMGDLKLPAAEAKFDKNKNAKVVYSSPVTLKMK
ncbi:hypothetical protein KY335_01685 [Candidatus Woesearchaeota archaeon]|nr:hypothetical protein [Candidatus Woesearchaeota archaeon]MBW3013934.1 hypothetical protein [Candidatus Woesearchaeota archaeon]